MSDLATSGRELSDALDAARERRNETYLEMNKAAYGTEEFKAARQAHDEAMVALNKATLDWDRHLLATWMQPSGPWAPPAPTTACGTATPRTTRRWCGST